MKKIICVAATILVLIIVGMLFMRGNEKDTEVTRKTTKVGFVYNGTIDDKGWGQSNYEGISISAKELNLSVMYKESVPFDESCEQVMQEMIDSGCEIIICNSFDYGPYIAHVAENNPETIFFHATGVQTADNVATYFGRIYQMRYLSGIVAGLQTESDSIGYVAAFPIAEVNRGINAFALGVRSVNPNAEIHVAWSESWTDDTANKEAAELLVDACDVDVLTMHCDTVAPLEVADERGIWSIGYNMDNQEDYPDSFLTAPVWNWESFYTPQILKCLQGKFKPDNYWEGVETGIVELAPLSGNVKEGIAQAVDEKRQMFDAGTFDVFYGPITDCEGRIKIGQGENMPDEKLLNDFDWYVEGIHIYEK